MIKLRNTNIVPKGYKKVMKGDYLVWEENSFNGLSIVGYETVTINDGGEYNVPLNVPLEILSNYYNYRFDLKKDGKTKFIFRGDVFSITSKGAFTLYQQGMWDINIVKSSKNPTKFI